MDTTAFRSLLNVFGPKIAHPIAENWHRPRPSLKIIRQQIFKYDRSFKTSRPNDPAYSMVINSLMKEFAPSEKLIPLSTGAAFAHPEFPSTKSPGMPWREYGFKTKGEVASDPKALSSILRDWDLIGRGVKTYSNLPDSMAFMRLHVSTKEKEKVRPVWGYPTAVMVEEARFFYPWIDALKQRKQDHCYGVGLEIARGGTAYINQMVTQTLNPATVIVAADWSEFDTTIPAWLIRDVFAILRTHFDFTQIRSSDGRVWPVKEEQSQRRFNALINYFINTPIRMADGTRYRKDQGVPSGSCFTNLIDTLVNAIVFRYCTFHSTGHFPKGDVYLGDDTLAVVYRPFDISSFKQFAFQVFGMILNEDKTIVTSNRMNSHFLGFYNLNGFPWRASDYLLASYVYPEHNVEDVIETATRALGQLYSTLYGPQAYKWYLVLREVQEYGDLTTSDIEAELQRNFTRSFRFLKHLGYEPGWLTNLDDRVDHERRTVVGIEPPLRPTRDFDSGRNCIITSGIHYWPLHTYRLLDDDHSSSDESSHDGLVALT